MSDDEATRLSELREIKRQRLHELDKRVARSGRDAPPDVQIERAELRRELGIVERAELAAASPAFIEQLGDSGRFSAYYSELTRANDGIALLGEALSEFKIDSRERLDSFVDDSREWRRMHRQLLLMIGVAVFFIAIAVTILVTYLAATGRL